VIIDEDPIVPDRIEHNVDEVHVAGRREQFYNFLDYWFVTPTGHVRARAYVDDMTTIVVHGPFAAADGAMKVGAPVDARVMAYLRRRFAKVRLFR
jgi:hypothetical protein